MFRFKGKPQSLGQIITNGAALYWASILDVWHISLALALLGIVPILVMIVQVHIGLFNMAPIVWGIILGIVLLPVKAFLTALIMYRIYLTGSLVHAEYLESAKFVLNKIFPLSIAYVISFAIVILGLIAFIIPGIFFSVMFVFITPLIVLDEHTVKESFQYSWLLVWKSWWRTFAVVVIPLILVIVGVPQPFLEVPSFFTMVLDVARLTIVEPLLFAMILVGFYDAKLRHHVALNLKKPKESIKHEDLSKKINT